VITDTDDANMHAPFFYNDQYSFTASCFWAFNYIHATQVIFISPCLCYFEYHFEIQRRKHHRR
jgi:hypothetical protein